LVPATRRTSGRVRLEVEREKHVDTEAQPGSIIGELALLDSLPRAVSAFAETRVEAAHLPVPAIEALCAERRTWVLASTVPSAATHLDVKSLPKGIGRMGK
jgi:CRP-like cAMP-binding protein